MRQTMIASHRSRGAKQSFDIHHDGVRDPAPEEPVEEYDEDEEPQDESEQEQDLVRREDEEDSDSDSSEEQGDAAVQNDIERFQESFKGIGDQYRIIKRIGEGTFSTVYKAEDLHYDYYNNDWDIEAKESSRWTSPPLKHEVSSSQTQPSRRKPKYVAIKKIYVTSSPARILNELDLLFDLRGCPSVAPLITAFRHTDQVVAVLPYFRHTDFREYFRDMTIPDIRIYFRSLFTALAAVHDKAILHRDIKPTNFLYEPAKQRGVLVDFGLAERFETDYKPCLCRSHASERKHRIQNSVAAAMGPSSGYPKNDSRPSRRANRAGTRGFRAPEVLFKCTAQTTAIDIWSAGVILLTILSKRFPFFNSADDVEAMIEISTIFGVKKMKQCAHLHGAVFETNLPTVGAGGFNLEKIILWSTCRNEKSGRPMSEEEKGATAFLERCLELDPGARITAREALQHEFLREGEEVKKESDTDEEEDEMVLL